MMRTRRTMSLAASGLFFAFCSLSFAVQTAHAQETRRDPSTIQVGVNLVALNVIVNDQMSRAVQGLKKEDFRVYDDGVEQSIAYFGSEDIPVSWGLVLDRSGSMMGMIRDVYRAAVHVVDEGTARDETFVVTFDTRFQLVCDFVSDRDRLQKCVSGLRAGGRTALWDAIAFGLDHLKQAKHRKKVLVVITDGEDNSSRLTFRDLLQRVKEEDVLIYTVGMFESRRPRGLWGRGADPVQELAELAEATGAQAHFPTDVKQCKQAMKEIAREVSQQYSLGFYPTNRAPAGKWHKVKVQVLSKSQKDEDLPKYVARTRTGYYAPKGEGLDKKGLSPMSRGGNTDRDAQKGMRSAPETSGACERQWPHQKEYQS